ncbi:hypothetical protein G3573_20980, partial [Caulobacter sp. 17J65-9]|nr:hypothetical protein [Caulobacter sp. 17J65-9]
MSRPVAAAALVFGMASLPAHVLAAPRAAADPAVACADREMDAAPRVAACD